LYLNDGQATDSKECVSARQFTVASALARRVRCARPRRTGRAGSVRRASAAQAAGAACLRSDALAAPSEWHAAPCMPAVVRRADRQRRSARTRARAHAPGFAAAPRRGAGQSHPHACGGALTHTTAPAASHAAARSRGDFTRARSRVQRCARARARAARAAAHAARPPAPRGAGRAAAAAVTPTTFVCGLKKRRSLSVRGPSLEPRRSCVWRHVKPRGQGQLVPFCAAFTPRWASKHAPRHAGARAVAAELGARTARAPNAAGAPRRVRWDVQYGNWHVLPLA
jgi:hypothetical protein